VAALSALGRGRRAAASPAIVLILSLLTCLVAGLVVAFLGDANQVALEV